MGFVGLGWWLRLNSPFLSLVWPQGQSQQRSWCPYWGTKPVASAWIPGVFAPLAAWCLSCPETPACPASTSSLPHQTPLGTLFCFYLTALSTFLVPWKPKYQKTLCLNLHILADGESFISYVKIYTTYNCVPGHGWYIAPHSFEQPWVLSIATSKSTTM